MKRDMVNLREKLALEIFSRRFVELDEPQQAFVDYHVGGYHTYVSNVAPVIRQALGKKLKKEYDTILDLYCLRLPSGYLRRAVDQGVAEARKKGKVTYSIGWFDRHFSEYVERYKKDVAELLEGRIDVEIDYPWFFNIFRYIRENDNDDFIFEPFWGFRERKKRGKKKRPVELQMVLKMREIDTVDSMIQSLRQFKGNYPKKKERIKTLKRRRKRLQQKIIELREEIDGGL